MKIEARVTAQVAPGCVVSDDAELALSAVAFVLLAVLVVFAVWCLSHWDRWP